MAGRSRRRKEELTWAAPEAPAAEARRLFAELLGTFFLTLTAAGGEMLGALSGGEVDHVSRVVAPGLVVMALIYVVGDISGAHFNPAVTLAFTLRRDFPVWRLPGYWAAQVLGAVLAAALLRALFGVVKHLGATTPRYGAGPALAMEIVLTLLLVLVILGTASTDSKIGPNAALAVGGTIALCGLFAGPVSGASMNPARSLGPALLGGALGGIWIYLLGPGAGAVLAVGCKWLLHGPEKPDEEEVATGKGNREG